MSTFTALDFETATGKRSSICQVGLTIVENCKIVDRISYLVRPPGNSYLSVNIGIHGITPAMTENEESFDKVYLKIKDYIVGKKVVAHNASFEIDCLDKALKFYMIPVPKNILWFCTYKIFKTNLSLACAMNGIVYKNPHSGAGDSEACALLMIKDILR
jgi:DNA polymerase-3 subunit epsilon